MSEGNGTVQREKSCENRPVIQSEKPTAIVVDDHHIVRLGIREFFDRHPIMTLVAEAETGERAVQLVAEHRPDMVFLDLNLPGMSGIETMRSILDIGPATKILILTIEQDRHLANRLVNAGARGFLSKNDILEELREAAETILAGGRYLGRSLTRHSPTIRQRQPMPIDVTSSFSEEEMKVFKCIADGLSHKEGSDKLGLSRQKYERIIRRLFGKTGGASEPQLVRLVLERP